MNSRQLKEIQQQLVAQNKFRSNQNNFTQRIQTNNEDLHKQKVVQQMLLIDGQSTDGQQFLQEQSNSEDDLARK